MQTARQRQSRLLAGNGILGGKINNTTAAGGGNQSCGNRPLHSLHGTLTDGGGVGIGTQIGPQAGNGAEASGIAEKSDGKLLPCHDGIRIEAFAAVEQAVLLCPSRRPGIPLILRNFRMGICRFGTPCGAPQKRGQHRTVQRKGGGDGGLRGILRMSGFEKTKSSLYPYGVVRNGQPTASGRLALQHGEFIDRFLRSAEFIRSAQLRRVASRAVETQCKAERAAQIPGKQLLSVQKDGQTVGFIFFRGTPAEIDRVALPVGALCVPEHRTLGRKPLHCGVRRNGDVCQQPRKIGAGDGDVPADQAVAVGIAVRVCNRGVCHGGYENGMAVVTIAQHVAGLDGVEVVNLGPGFDRSAVIVIAQLIGIAEALNGTVKGIAATGTVEVAIAVDVPAGGIGIAVWVVGAAMMVPVFPGGELGAKIGERNLCALGMRRGKRKHCGENQYCEKQAEYASFHSHDRPSLVGLLERKLKCL